MERQKQTDANVSARVHAIGWSGLFNGFLKEEEKNKAIKWQEFLPFDVDDADRCRVSKSTAEAYLRAQASGLVPIHVQGAFIDLLAEMRRLCE